MLATQVVVIFVACSSLLVPAFARADVADSSATGFSIRIARTIDAPAADVYARFVNDIGAWWEPSHTFSGESKNMSIEAAPGGCWCEALPNGGGVQHMRVVYVVPGETIKLAGGLGPLQDLAVAGAMSFSVSEPADAPGRTEAVLTYNAGGYLAAGLASWAPAVDFVLTTQMDRLTRYIETGEADAPAR